MGRVIGFVLAAMVLSASAWASRATLTFYADTKGEYFHPPRCLSIHGREVERLIAQLPEVGKRKGSLRPAGWKGRVRIEFSSIGGKPVTAYVHFYGTRWTWGHAMGDFPASTGLRDLLAKLERRAK